MQLNPFAFGAAGYPFFGPENFLHSFFFMCCSETGEIVRGTLEQLIEGALGHQDNRFSKEELEEGLDNILNGTKTHGGQQCFKPLIFIEPTTGFIMPTENFGIIQNDK